MAPRLFVTGGSGYLGAVLIPLATKDYTVYALSRSESSDKKLEDLGAIPVRGDVTSLDVLRKEAAQADAVLHLATAYVFGGPPYEEILPIDNAAADALAESLVGTEKPLIVTSGTLSVAADPSGAETTESSPPEPSPLNTRIKAERHALSHASKGVRVMSIRLAPYVYGRGGSGVQRFMGMAAQAGNVTFIDGGKNRTTNVHVDDAARLYLLALEKGKAGEIYNASSATDITAGQIFGAIGTAIGVPVKDISKAEAEATIGPFITFFLAGENRASGAKAVKELGWEPKEQGILDEINHGSYQEVAKALRK